MDQEEEELLPDEEEVSVKDTGEANPSGKP